MRFGASTASGFGLAILCGTILFVGCGDDSGDSDRTGGVGGSTAGSTATGGTAGTGTGGTAGSTGGTTSGGTGGTGSTVNACPAAATVTGGLITDFEGADDKFESGGYYTYVDPQAGGTVSPEAAAPYPEDLPAARDGSTRAFHFTGEGLAANAWSGFGLYIVDCANAGGVDGIQFYVQSDVAMEVGVTVPGTQSTEFQGECTAATCTPNTADVPASPDAWTLVELEWADFAGGTAPVTPEEVMGLNFSIVAGTTADWGFDVWVDDVSWLGGTPGGEGGAGGGGNDGAGGAAAGAGGAM